MYACVYIGMCMYVCTYSYMDACGCVDRYGCKIFMICMSIYIYMSTCIITLIDVLIIYLINTFVHGLCLPLVRPYLRFRSLIVPLTFDHTLYQPLCLPFN